MPPSSTAATHRQETFKQRAKVAIATRGLHISDIARELGVNRVTASRAINTTAYEPTRKKIAEYLGIAA